MTDGTGSVPGTWFIGENRLDGRREEVVVSEVALSAPDFALAMRVAEQTYGDGEDTHKVADQVMANQLEALGFGAGVAIWREMPKWYA